MTLIWLFLATILAMEAVTLRLNPDAPLPADVADWDSPATLALVFGQSRPWPERAIARIKAALPRATLLGCSTAGEILGNEVTDGTVVLSLVRFRDVRLKLTSAAINAPLASRDAGLRLAQDLAAPDLRAVFVLSDGLGVNGSQLVDGLAEALPEGVVITGGLAADGDRFERTWVILDGKPQSGFVTAAGLYGSSLVIGHGSRGR